MPAAALATGIARANEHLGPGKTLSGEQLRAVEHLTSPSAIAIAVGIAGSGKSTLLNAAREVWVANGNTVYGAAVAGKATRGLQTSSGIESKTVAKWLMLWDNGRDLPAAGSIFVLDEAGMVGTTDMLRLAQTLNARGAKFVLAGDPAQLQPIAAGAPLRRMNELIGYCELNTVIRQRNSLHAAATVAFQAGKIAEGLKPYYAEGAVDTHSDIDGAINALVSSYLSVRLDPKTIEKEQIAIAPTNVLSSRINQSIRAAFRDHNLLGNNFYYDTTEGPKMFAKGDQIVAQRTETLTLGDRALQLDNGTIGTVLDAKRDELVISFPSEKPVTLTPAVYKDLAHGYAITVHKAQGVTVDIAHVLPTAFMDRSSAYVAFSRHRETVRIYEPQSSLRGTLTETLSRAHDHTNALEVAAKYLQQRGLPTTDDNHARVLGDIERQRLATARLAFRAINALHSIGQCARQAFAKTAEIDPTASKPAGLEQINDKVREHNARVAGSKVAPGATVAATRASVTAEVSKTAKPITESQAAVLQDWLDAWRAAANTSRDQPAFEFFKDLSKIATEKLDHAIPGARSSILWLVESNAEVRRDFGQPHAGALLLKHYETERGLTAEQRAHRLVTRWVQCTPPINEYVSESKRAQHEAEQRIVAKTLGRDPELVAVLRNGPKAYGLETMPLLSAAVASNQPAEALSQSIAKLHSEIEQHMNPPSRGISL